MNVVWKFHVYEHQTHALWGYGYLDDAIWEYFGNWSEEDGVRVKWRTHKGEGVLRNMSRTSEISINQRSMGQMEKLIPNFENKLLGTFIYAKMKGSEELSEPT